MGPYPDDRRRASAGGCLWAEEDPHPPPYPYTNTCRNGNTCSNANIYFGSHTYPYASPYC